MPYSTSQKKGKSACEICSQFKKSESTYEKRGLADPEENTYLNPVYKELKQIKEIENVGRFAAIKQCPFCEQYYFHKTDSEFLADGSEFEQWLVKIESTLATKILESNEATQREIINEHPDLNT